MDVHVTGSLLHPHQPFRLPGRVELLQLQICLHVFHRRLDCLPVLLLLQTLRVQALRLTLKHLIDGGEAHDFITSTAISLQDSSQLLLG
jgi:hypothetical protein